jgi:hypothetical protein
MYFLQRTDKSNSWFPFLRDHIKILHTYILPTIDCVHIKLKVGPFEELSSLFITRSLRICRGLSNEVHLMYIYCTYKCNARNLTGSTELKSYVYIYRVFRAQADWSLILLSATSCESVVPLSEKSAAARQNVLRSSVDVWYACTMNTVYINILYRYYMKCRHKQFIRLKKS